MWKEITKEEIVYGATELGELLGGTVLAAGGVRS